jgi:excisionase family DNA binding protein
VSDYASNEPPLVLRVVDVAHLLQVSESAVYALIASGELPSLRVGRSVRVPREALEAWITARTVTPVHRSDLPPPIGQDTRPEGWTTATKAAGSTTHGTGDVRPASIGRQVRAVRQPSPTKARTQPEANVRREPRPWRTFLESSAASGITSDAELMAVVKRLEDHHWFRLGVAEVVTEPIHERGICWNVRQAYERSHSPFGGTAALHFDTWYPDMVVLANDELAEALRADNPWFPIFDEERFRLEIADMRADVLGEGESPFPDRVKRREVLRRQERRRERRERQGVRERG